jgi:FkbM family methyltransferase
MGWIRSQGRTLAAVNILHLSSMYRDLSCCLWGRGFCTAFNLAAIVRGKSVRFKRHHNNDPYEVWENGQSRRFLAKKQACHFYWKGLGHRAAEIGSRYMLHLVDLNPGDLVVDCGANVGDLELYLQTRDSGIGYLGVEPSPAEFSCLMQNVGRANCVNVGLWSEEANLQFYVSSASADSSFIVPRKFDEILEVKATRLDSIVSRPVRLLKLEAEGAEPEVLIGAEGVLKRTDFIAADLGPERGLSEECTLHSVTNYLLDRGFRMVAFNARRVTALYKRLDAK